MSLTPPLFHSLKADDPTQVGFFKPSDLNAITSLLTRLFDGGDATGTVLTRDALSSDGASWRVPSGGGVGVYDVRSYGAVGNGVADDTAAIQAAVTAATLAGHAPVWLPVGVYKITGTIVVGEGTSIIGAYSQGSNELYGTVLKHYGTGDCLRYDGSGRAFAGTGGQIANLLIVKADGFSGGAAIKILATDDNHRPGEMMVTNVLVYGLSGTAFWDRGLHIDGTACTTLGSKGVRSVILNKVRVADCLQSDQYIYLSQAVHCTGTHLAIDTGHGTGNPGMTIDGDSDNVSLSNLVINGTLAVEGTADIGVCLLGRVSTLDVNNPNVVGTAALRATTVNSAAVNFRISANCADAFEGYRTTLLTNQTGDGTGVTVTYDLEAYDKGPSFNPATGIFTARCAGTYQFTAQVAYQNLIAGHIRADTTLVHLNAGLSTVAAYTAVCNAFAGAAANNLTVPLSAQMELNEGDQVSVLANVSGSTKTVTLYGSAGTRYTYFAGHLLP